MLIKNTLAFAGVFDSFLVKLTSVYFFKQTTRLLLRTIRRFSVFALDKDAGNIDTLSEVHSAALDIGVLDYFKSRFGE